MQNVSLDSITINSRHECCNDHVSLLSLVVPVHSVAAEIAKIHNVNVDKIISRLTEVHFHNRL